MKPPKTTPEITSNPVQLGSADAFSMTHIATSNRMHNRNTKRVSQHSLDDLKIFVQLAHFRNLTEASKMMGMPVATLSRRLKALESALGCRLLDRSAHHFKLTEVGQQYVDACAPLLEDLTAVSDLLYSDQHQAHGVLNIAAPVNVSQSWLGKAVGEFMKMHPNIRVNMSLSNRNINLVEAQFDLAFRVGPQADSDWIARPLLHTHSVLCAAGSYHWNEGPLEHPRDLHLHRHIVSAPVYQWTLRNKLSNDQVIIKPEPWACADDNLVALNWVKQGVGIGFLPTHLLVDGSGQVNHDIQICLPDWQGLDRTVHLVYRDRALMPARLRLFIDFILGWSGFKQPDVDF